MRLSLRRQVWAFSSALVLCALAPPLAAEDQATPATPAPPPEEQKLTSSETPPVPVPLTPKPRKLFESEEGAIRMLNRAQFRWTDTFPDGEIQLSGTPNPGDSKGSFRIRRAKTEFTGWVWKKELTFELQLSWAGPEPGTSTQTPLEDLLLTWDASKHESFRITVGQFKVPFGRQEMTSSGKQQFCDRDLLSFEFTRGRDIGIQFDGELLRGQLEYAAGIFNGNPASRLGNDNNKYQYNLRLMYQPWGKVGYSEGDFESKDKPLLAVAAQFEHNDQRGAASSLSPITELKTVNLAGDVVFKYKGFSAFAEVFLRNREPDSDSSFNSNGWHAQAGYFVKRDVLEAALRYARWDPSDAEADDEQIERGVALNYFFRKHGLKLQADFRELEGRFQGLKTKELRVQTQVMF